jgi:NADH-quinone oxidoreductase subunit A
MHAHLIHRSPAFMDFIRNRHGALAHNYRGRFALRQLWPSTVDGPNVALRHFVRCAKPHLLPSLRHFQTGQGRISRGCGAGGYTLRSPMSELLLDYLPLVIFVAVALMIGLALLITPFIVAYSQPDPEKLSAYECGFNAFDDARMKFDVRFYLVAILFIIFDLEVSFLFPWAVAFRHIGVYGFWSMMLFLGVLTVGFIYEWNKGALEWD